MLVFRSVVGILAAVEALLLSMFEPSIPPAFALTLAFDALSAALINPVSTKPGFFPFSLAKISPLLSTADHNIATMLDVELDMSDLLRLISSSHGTFHIASRALGLDSVTIDRTFSPAPTNSAIGLAHALENIPLADPVQGLGVLCLDAAPFDLRGDPSNPLCYDAFLSGSTPDESHSSSPPPPSSAHNGPVITKPHTVPDGTVSSTPSSSASDELKSIAIPLESGTGVLDEFISALRGRGWSVIQEVFVLAIMTFLLHCMEYWNGLKHLLASNEDVAASDAPAVIEEVCPAALEVINSNIPAVGREFSSTKLSALADDSGSIDIAPFSVTPQIPFTKAAVDSSESPILPDITLLPSSSLGDAPFVEEVERTGHILAEGQSSIVVPTLSCCDSSESSDVERAETVHDEEQANTTVSSSCADIPSPVSHADAPSLSVTRSAMAESKLNQETTSLSQAATCCDPLAQPVERAAQNASGEDPKQPEAGPSQNGDLDVVGHSTDADLGRDDEYGTLAHPAACDAPPAETVEHTAQISDEHEFEQPEAGPSQNGDSDFAAPDTAPSDPTSNIEEAGSSMEPQKEKNGRFSRGEVYHRLAEQGIDAPVLTMKTRRRGNRGKKRRSNNPAPDTPASNFPGLAGTAMAIANRHLAATQ
ncbi:hypothetical protein K488DRAFT_86275 [Vararia minispora EC-137]|uniref:Uncharacterized protein n=1 Tax=Vararia minispora EC-137 TaxID=1314806 RepID=A0ACB8QKW5_9AGAM|nr:hypothetical protein K488DRAFT_86275 [Vararia minispora EC-137]